jgi:hypothetical protein
MSVPSKPKPKQIEQLEKHATILSSSLDTIEACGGGSQVHDGRVFLPKQKKTFNIGLVF